MKNTKYPNLRPWQSGQSGNPAGRKRGSKNISTIVRELLEQDVDSKMLANSSISEFTQDMSTTYAKAVVLATINKALQGNVQAISWLTEQQERDVVVQDGSRQEPVIVSSIKSRHFAVD